MNLDNTISTPLYKQLEERLRTLSAQSEYQMKETRETVERRLNAIQKDNSDQLSRIRETVDEKLQKTLEERLGQSFKQVSDQLQQVYKGLGEMQTLATGVGDLKKVLSNVKTRGILGEIQLGAILEQILAPEQYSTNVATRPGSRDVVEYAVRLPGSEEGGVVWLPIDAKFPGDLYGQLMDAYDQGDKEVIQGLQKQLEQRIKAEARDIRDKYIEPPYTTEFGILFLPVEGLYAEVVRLGLLADRELDGGALRSLVDKLSLQELEELRKSWARRAEERLPLKTQLDYREKKVDLAERDRAFMV